MSNQSLQNQSSLDTSFQKGALKRCQWTQNMHMQKFIIDEQISSSQSIKANDNIRQNNCLDVSIQNPHLPINASFIITDSYDQKKQDNFTQEYSQYNTIDVSQQFDPINQEMQQNQVNQQECALEQKSILTQTEKKEETTVENDDYNSDYQKQMLFSNYYVQDSLNFGKCLFERLGINGKYTLSQSLALFFNIHRFVKKVKNTEKNKFRNLTLAQHEYINDISSNYNYFLHRNKFRTTPNLYEQWKHKFAQLNLRKKLSDFTFGRILINFAKKLDFIILPNSTFYTIFSITMLIIILRIIIFVPLFLSQQQNTQIEFVKGSGYLWSNILSCLGFCFEIIFKLNTAIYIRGELIYQRKKIFKRLLKSKKLFLDILLTVIIIFTSAYSMDYISFLLLFKVKDLQQILLQLELKYQLKGNLQALIEMIKLIFFILFMAHMVACGAMFIQKIELSSEYNKVWFTQNLNQSWIEMYVNAFYWSIVTMVTLGYGDIIPVTLCKNFFSQKQHFFAQQKKQFIQILNKIMKKYNIRGKVRSGD
ncbi:cation channel family protein (macronuclear) [Tetrahymena thermophila SB210]|uniref:Cation channel family protein n=1 Tax=Tetrahymena thermophila (strain SB210) TaxID=312017 RepID=Q23F95_TETTS|nr:cation channel family protein [Tetrahymena thermophila SB210]EAR95258.2 cation channel family protein [Tetrahymena thermophila SB210]|eukprot:XP_001015503.2 cation channel family protein [Tetrahymena thermophila SB210]